MPLPLLATLAINIALTALSAVLTRRGKAQVRAEPLRVDPPTAGEPIPLVFGTMKVPLKVVAFWGARAEPIYKKSRIFGSPALTIGSTQICTRYWVKMAALLSHGSAVTRVLDLIVDGKSLAAAGISFETSSVSIDKAGLLGGDFANGGVVGPIRVHTGDGQGAADARAQAQSGLVADLVAQVPDWRHYCYLIFDDVWVGNSPTLPPLHAVVRREPASPSYGAGRLTLSGIDAVGDANPACVLWELLTHPAYGLGLPPELLDDGSFSAFGTAATGGQNSLGLSFVLDRAQAASSVLTDVLRVLDASLYTNPTTGKLGVWWHREPSHDVYGYPSLAALVRVGPGVARACEWTAPQPAQVCNQVEVRYIDRRMGYRANTVVAKNDALIAEAGQVLPQTLELIGISTEAMAQRLAARELRQITTPLGVVRLVCDRRPAGLFEGKQFVLDWPAYGLADVVMRVTGIDHGTPDDPSVTIEAAEDLYALPGYEADAVVSEPWDDPAPADGYVGPEVDEVAVQGDYTGTLTLTITDPQARVTAVRFNTQTGSQAPSAWVVDPAAPWTATVTLDPKRQSYIGWQVDYTTLGGGTATLEGAVAFEADVSQPGNPTTPAEPIYARTGGAPEPMLARDGGVLFARAVL
jgi:hypothetical protein